MVCVRPHHHLNILKYPESEAVAESHEKEANTEGEGGPEHGVIILCHRHSC
jgi:hypothetical protein